VGSAIREVLPERLPAMVVLQGGQRPHSLNQLLIDNLAAPRNTVRILAMAELDNYLLDPDLIARVSGAASEAVYDHLDEAMEALRQAAMAAFVAADIRVAGSNGSTLKTSEERFRAMWTERENRLRLVRGSQVIRRINGWLEGDGYKTLSSRELAKSIKPTEIADELLDLLLEIEEKLL
jgi:hypothetical protein